MRECSKCGQHKPLDDFAKNARARDGLQRWCRECKRAYMKDKRQEPEFRRREDEKASRGSISRRRYELWRLYRVTLEAYDEMLVEQGGVCALCGNPPTRLRLAVDHCHATGRVRGLLCARCNGSLGQLGDNEAGVRRVLAYVCASRSA